MMAMAADGSHNPIFLTSKAVQADVGNN